MGKTTVKSAIENICDLTIADHQVALALRLIIAHHDPDEEARSLYVDVVRGQWVGDGFGRIDRFARESSSYMRDTDKLAFRDFCFRVLEQVTA